MSKATGGAIKAAWFLTLMCVLLILGMLVLQWFEQAPHRLPYLLIPFLVFLPTAFFAIVHDQRGLEEEIRGLRDRVQELERITLEFVGGTTEQLRGPPDRPAPGPLE